MKCKYISWFFLYMFESLMEDSLFALTLFQSCWDDFLSSCVKPGLEVIKLEFILRLKIMHNDWLLEDKCTQSANHCALF